MSDYRRSRLGGGVFFFTVLVYKRREILTEPLARECLREAIEKVRKDWPFTVAAMCLLPNHLHCIWQMPDEDGDYSVRWSLIKKHFTRRYLSEGGREIGQSPAREEARYRGIWQKKFWEHRIKNEEDMDNHIRYIHYNPVKHGYVDDPFRWPWSTIHAYYGDRQVDGRPWEEAKEMVLSSYME